MIVDGHAHACGTFLTVEEIEKNLNKSQVDKVVLTPGELDSKTVYHIKNKAVKKPYGDVVSGNNRITKLMIRMIGAVRKIPVGNERVYELKQQLPERILQMYWVTKANYGQIEQDYQKMKFDGVKLHQCWEYFDIESDWFERVVHFANEKGLPVFIHVYSLKEIRKLITYIKKHPETKIIVAHLYGMELFVEENMENYENLYFDISNCYFVSKERIEMAYQKFGRNKLMLGSDTPYGIESLVNTKALVESLAIPQEDKVRILGTNAIELFGIHGI
ncbi:amidohydrolase family protein [Roseburia sp. 499]|uniref:amidohydrolase family protein n=1 Tax=Roseburia sp. 499 TaxID=1261634 RepID=UPI00095144DE|nr:TatD family hydrolase [Roseburia sp. 499]WVK70383.1 TatD family hydrolase [Roseburia sp. 499]